MSARNPLSRLLVLGLGLGLGACSGLDHLGKEPTVSPAGASRTRLQPPADIAAPPANPKPTTTTSTSSSQCCTDGSGFAMP